MNKSLSISVAMATYNGEKYLRAQLDSLAAQTVLPIELQIGDDGSTDRTEEIVREFAASAPFSVVFHRNETNLGYGENFLRTALRCSGEWIAFCDQDDVWLPQKIDVIRSRISEGDNTLALVAHNCCIIDHHGREIDDASLASFSTYRFAHLELSPTWLCAGFRQVFRAALIHEFGIRGRIGTLSDPVGQTGFDPLPHDGWIPFLANVTGTIETIDERLVRYRRHSDNATVLTVFDGEVRTFGSNAVTYRKQARWFSAAAKTVSQLAPTTRRKITERSLVRLCQESAWLNERANVQDGPNLKSRFRSLFRLIRERAYWRSWSMSTKSLVKDFSLALFGAPIASRDSA